ncbi:MAG: glycine zipper 2TM domain-containing protein [Nitrosomonadales bacterium]|nr:glycine zipper 2TM domain-containing protein [Nitrosomonadales bacterium]
MKKLVLGMLAAIGSGGAWAADFVDTAKVVSSAPIYERVSEPKQECWTETVSSSGAVTRSAPVEERSIGGALVGGVIGGVVGSQVGQGTGNTVATAAGAIAGAIIGDRVANQNQGAAQTATQAPQAREERRCRQVDSTREVIRGYNVTYRYNGQEVTARLPYQPGATVRVGVSVLEEGGAGEARDSHSGSDVRDYRGSDKRERHRKDRRDGD